MKSKYTKKEFEKAVMTSNSIREVLIKLDVKPIGGNYKVFYRNAKKFDVNVAAFINPSTYGVQKEKRACIKDSNLIKAIEDNISFRAILLEFGLTEGSSNYRWLKAKINKLKIDTSHFLGEAHLRGKTHNWSKKTPLKKLLIVNSVVGNSHHLKIRLIKENILKEECNRCGITEWEGDKLSLHLDHINGINTDYRIENLRLLCPNCHSLTETYCRKK
jgi:hypothetical protein